MHTQVPSENYTDCNADIHIHTESDLDIEYILKSDINIVADLKAYLVDQTDEFEVYYNEIGPTKYPVEYCNGVFTKYVGTLANLANMVLNWARYESNI